MQQVKIGENQEDSNSEAEIEILFEEDRIATKSEENIEIKEESTKVVVYDPEHVENVAKNLTPVSLNVRFVVLWNSNYVTVETFNNMPDEVELVAVTIIKRNNLYVY